jgi:hypothetical protein
MSGVGAIERALKKQILLREISTQRQVLAQHARGLKPLFDAADQVRTGVRWVRRHPEAVAGGVAVLVAVRPRTLRFFWRWGQRGFVAWRLWRESNRWLGRPFKRLND